MSNIIIKPLLTEKTTAMQEDGVYTFQVARTANKLQIKEAVQAIYPDVTVIDIRTSITSRKPKQRYTKSGAVSGATKLTKKAFVQLAEGDFIDVFGGEE